MKLPLYITSLVTLFGGIVAMPGIEEAVRVYLVSVVVTVSFVINLLFRWGKVREWIVNRIMVDVFYRMMNDENYKDFITWKLQKDGMIKQEKKNNA